MGFLRAARSAPLSGDRSGQTFRAWVGQVEKANSPSPVRDKTAHSVFGASVFFDAPQLLGDATGVPPLPSALRTLYLNYNLNREYEAQLACSAEVKNVVHRNFVLQTFPQ